MNESLEKRYIEVEVKFIEKLQEEIWDLKTKLLHANNRLETMTENYKHLEKMYHEECMECKGG